MIGDLVSFLVVLLGASCIISGFALLIMLARRAAELRWSEEITALLMAAGLFGLGWWLL